MGNYLSGEEEKQAAKYLAQADEETQKALCLRSKCGSVIVKDDELIGRGNNSPPDKKPIEKCIKDSLPKNFKSEKHCCIHAEQMAIIDALKNHPDKIIGSTLYFTRRSANNVIMLSGKPYCTICSKMALYVGISEFVLHHEEGICVYDTKEYNKLSFQFRE